MAEPVPPAAWLNRSARAAKFILRPGIRLLDRVGLGQPLREALLPPGYPGLRVTPKRLLNLYVRKYQRLRGHTKLHLYPRRLILEATNACNLRCPYCFTGAGELGRERSMMSMSLYERVLEELGDYLLYIEFCNWGEPLLHKRLFEMIAMASRRGISTLIATNFSLPFTSEQAEAMVNSRLALLGVSLDGAGQETFEKYRVGGNLDLAIENIRTVVEAKKRLASPWPRVIWSYHIFEWNQDEIEAARSIATDLGIEFAATKGWIAGEEWDRRGQFSFGTSDIFAPGAEPERCGFLWFDAVIHNDGGVSPCDGTFYQEDDYGSLVDSTFRAVWNNEKFQAARRLFRQRRTSNGRTNLICQDCPCTRSWQDYQQHRRENHPASTFDPSITANDCFNYFFNRMPARRHAQTTADTISLTSAANPPTGSR